MRPCSSRTLSFVPARLFGLLAAGLLLLASAGCESILGAVEIRDPGVGEPCAKGERCGPGAECLPVLALDEDSPLVCLPMCGGKKDPVCPEGYGCVPKSSYSSEGFCRPSATLRVYKEGDRCPDSGSDPCGGDLTCVVPPSSNDVGGSPSRACLLRCQDREDFQTCTGGRSCEETTSDGFFCE